MKRTLIGAAVLALGLTGIGASFAGTEDGQGARPYRAAPALLSTLTR